MTRRRAILKLAYHWLGAVFDFRRMSGVVHLPRYFADWRRYNRLAGPGALRWRESYPALGDRLPFTPFDPQYFYQACWAARKLARSTPDRHVDVGSGVLIAGMLSASVPTVFVDVRPLAARLPDLAPLSGDLLALPYATASVTSLSCLHVIEHVGLGRYGDALDPRGSEKAANELVRVLAAGGRLLLSTPVGHERVQFNAHRVFAPQTVLGMFGDLDLVDFAMVDDDGRFLTGMEPAVASDCEYACGFFEFEKR